MAKRKKRASKKAAAAASTGAGRPSRLSAVDTAALQMELQRRQRGLGALERKHQKLLGQLATIEAQIAALGGPAGGGGGARRGRPAGRKRPENSTTLVDALAKTLKGKTMGVSEAAEAVVASGYNTNAANFRTIVNQTLLKHTDVFKKVDRGQYTAK